jgi:hypothetical protein
MRLLERIMQEPDEISQSKPLAHGRELIPGEIVPPELPVLHLGAMDALHRRSIDDDPQRHGASSVLIESAREPSTTVDDTSQTP